MNYKSVFNILGSALLTVGGLMALPLLVSAIYREDCFWAFLIAIGIAAFLGFALKLICRTKNQVIYAKEGFAVVALVWMLMAAVGALPFVISGEMTSYTDAFFETVSGFTTTGASVVDNIEEWQHGTLFWRSFTHWVGGMGVLVFVMAIVPNLSDRSIHIMRAEMPGPVIGKLLPRAKDTAKILYLIYLGMSAAEFVLLLCGEMNVFESFLHTFGTAGTGGFGIKYSSIGGYSAYSQWVIGVFMLLFGINFNLYYLILIKRFKSVLKSTELWVYLSIFALSTTAITLNILSYYKENLSLSVRHAFLQVSSIMTTTGFATDDFNKWPVFSKSLILVLMLMGACAGSTAGGLKIIRPVMLVKMIRREFKRMLHPHSVGAVRCEGRTVDEETLKGVSIYFAIYVICIIAAFLLISFEPLSIETNLSAAISCFNNIGPGLDRVGPVASYSVYSNFSTWVLSFAMLLGRLEIYPLLIAFSPSTWMKK